MFKKMLQTMQTGQVLRHYEKMARTKTNSTQHTRNVKLLPWYGQ